VHTDATTAGDLQNARMRLAVADPGSTTANNGQQSPRRHRALRPADPLRCPRHLPRRPAHRVVGGRAVDLTYRDESIDDVRAALRAYGQGLLQVAEKAR
jgi:hypothetical protein